MDKRVLYAVIISMGIVFAWTKFFAPKPPVAHHEPTATQPSGAATPPTTPPQPSAAQPSAATEKSTEKTAAKPGEAKPGEAKPSEVKPGEEKPPAKESLFEQAEHYRATFTSWGAAPIHWVLLNPQYKVDNPKETNAQASPIDLIRIPSPDANTAFKFGNGTELASDAAWVEQPRGPNGELTYTWDSGDTHVEKHYAMVPGTYETHLTITVENRGDKPLTNALSLQMHGWHDPSQKAGGFLSRRVSQTEGLCDVAGKLKKGNLESLLKLHEKNETLDGSGNVRWVGVGEQYFVTAAALKPDPSETRTCSIYGLPDGRFSATLRVPDRTAAPHGKTTYELALFFGPKILSQLDAAKAGGVDAGLGTAVDYGWTEAIARPMLAVLKGVHVVVPNWGFAIIVLTILLKAITWWPTTRSMKSMKAMAKLKPEMDKLKEKYGDDKQGMNVAVMDLYKKHGVNPLGGCLPMLIQMPIYIALYSMLGNSVELYRSGFVLWIRDLTAPDPFYVLPILTGVIMFVQQRLSPTPPDQQQKMMMYLMPVMFTAFSIFLPAGLTVYILTNTILTMLQQWWMNRSDKPARPKVLAKPARA